MPMISEAPEIFAAITEQTDAAQSQHRNAWPGAASRN
jgi:hypothetical protein